MEKQHLLADLEIRFYNDAEFNMNFYISHDDFLEEDGNIQIEQLSKFDPDRLEFEEWFSFN